MITLIITGSLITFFAGIKDISLIISFLFCGYVGAVLASIESSPAFMQLDLSDLRWLEGTLKYGGYQKFRDLGSPNQRNRFITTGNTVKIRSRPESVEVIGPYNVLCRIRDKLVQRGV
jgi:hypothetical protein